jgi:hypothetical protein
MAFEGAHFLSCGHLPQLDRPTASSEPEARSFPSGLNATEVTQPVWPSRVRTSCPVATSHSLIVLSSEPEARSRPSGLNAGGEELPVGAERHGPDPVGVAFEGAHFSSCGHLPQLDRLVPEPEARSFPSGLNATELTSRCGL